MESAPFGALIIGETVKRREPCGRVASLDRRLQTDWQIVAPRAAPTHCSSLPPTRPLAGSSHREVLRCVLASRPPLKYGQFKRLSPLRAASAPFFWMSSCMTYPPKVVRVQYAKGTALESMVRLYWTKGCIHLGAIPLRSFWAASSNSRHIPSCLATHGSATRVSIHSSYAGTSTPDGLLKQFDRCLVRRTNERYRLSCCRSDRTSTSLMLRPVARWRSWMAGDCSTRAGD